MKVHMFGTCCDSASVSLYSEYEYSSSFSTVELAFCWMVGALLLFLLLLAKVEESFFSPPALAVAFNPCFSFCLAFSPMEDLLDSGSEAVSMLRFVMTDWSVLLFLLSPSMDMMDLSFPASPLANGGWGWGCGATGASSSEWQLQVWSLIRSIFQYRAPTDFRPLRHIFVHFCGLPTAFMLHWQHCQVMSECRQRPKWDACFGISQISLMV